MLDQAFESLKTFDWGTDLSVLKPIEDALVSSHGNAAERLELEQRLAATLTSNLSRAARDFVCRQLMRIGTAASIPTLSGMLSVAEDSHMVRYALERIPAAEAAAALRAAVASLPNELKIGAIASLGARRDQESIPTLAQLLTDADAAVARSAAMALGAIRTAAAAKALSSAKPTDPGVVQAATDASFACAEGLLSEGKKAEALTVYKRFASDAHPRLVRVAATRGMLACAGKTQ